MGHVEDLLVRAREGELPQDEAARAGDHVAECARCAGFDRALARGQAALRSRVPDLALPPMQPGVRGGGVARRALAVAATLSVLVVALGLGLALQQLRADEGRSTAQRSGRAVGVIEPSVGGALVLLEESGREMRRMPLGLVDPDDRHNEPPPTVLHGPTGRVAIWRHRPAGPRPLSELLVWDGRDLRVLATVHDLRPEWPIWSADGEMLYFTALSPESHRTARPPLRARLHAVSFRTGQLRTIRDYENVWGYFRPLIATGTSLAGWEWGESRRYLILATDSGREMAAWPISEPLGGLPAVDLQTGFVAMVAGSTEGPPTTLRRWRADDYSDHSLITWAEISSAQFVPGTGNLIVAGRRDARGPFEVVVLDRAGRMRVLLTSDVGFGVAAVAPDGRSVLIWRWATEDAAIYDLSVDRLAERPGGAVVHRTAGTPFGWIAVR